MYILGIQRLFSGAEGERDGKSAPARVIPVPCSPFLPSILPTE